MLPTLTDPVIVQQAVAGVLKGHIRLSSSNVEAVLVLANAVGVSHLLGSSEFFISGKCMHAVMFPVKLCFAEVNMFEQVTAEQVHLLMAHCRIW